MNELDELMATEVIGYSIIDGQICIILPESRPPGLMVTQPIYNWHPTTDLNQAKRCLVKFCSDAHCHAEIKYNYIDDMWLVQVWNEVPVTDTDADICGDSTGKTLELAICEATRNAISPNGENDDGSEKEAVQR